MTNITKEQQDGLDGIEKSLIGANQLDTLKAMAYTYAAHAAHNSAGNDALLNEIRELRKDLSDLTRLIRARLA